MSGGVYRIRNVINDDCYVGVAVKFDRRRRNHFFLLRNKRHHSVHLQRAVEKYGIENFVYEPLFVCAPDYALKLEQRLLDVGVGKYNVSRDSLSPMRGLRQSDSAREKIRAARTGSVRPEHGEVLRRLWQVPEIREKYCRLRRGKAKSASHKAKLAAHLITAREHWAQTRRMKLIHRALHHGIV